MIGSVTQQDAADYFCFGVESFPFNECQINMLVDVPCFCLLEGWQVTKCEGSVKWRAKELSAIYFILDIGKLMKLASLSSALPKHRCSSATYEGFIALKPGPVAGKTVLPEGNLPFAIILSPLSSVFIICLLTSGLRRDAVHAVNRMMLPRGHGGLCSNTDITLS